MKLTIVVSLVAVVLRTEAKYLRSEDPTTTTPEPQLDENIDSVVRAFPELREFLSNYKSVQVIPKDTVRLVAPPPFMDEICYTRKPMCLPMPNKHSPLTSLFVGGYQQHHPMCFEQEPYCINPYQLISETETMLKQCTYYPNLAWCGRLLKLQALDKAILQEQCEEIPGVPCEIEESPQVGDRLRQCEWDVTLPWCKALKNHLRALGAIAIDRIMQIAREDMDAIKESTTSTTSPSIRQDQCEEIPGVPCETEESTQSPHVEDRLRQCEWDVSLPWCKALTNDLRDLGAIAIDRIMQIARGNVAAIKDSTTSTTSPSTIKPNRQIFYEDDKLPLWLTLGIKNRMKTSTPGY